MRSAICELVAHVATVLGHELAFSDPAAGVPLPPADALILEPAAPGAIACAKAFRNAQPALPILCISSCSDAPGCDELAPVVYLVKPFELAGRPSSSTRTSTSSSGHRSSWADESGGRGDRRATRSSSYGAAQESNLPSLGLPDLTGFEDRLGHRAPAAPNPA